MSVYFFLFQVSQIGLWTSDSPRPGLSLHDICIAEKENQNENFLRTFYHHEKNMDEDTPTVASLLNTEPHVWSRLKIIYSFEYSGKTG